MGLFSGNKTAFDWVQLETEDQLNELIDSSKDRVVLFFKHSTHCSISAFALRNFEHDWNTGLPVTCVYLDLLNHRDLSNLLAEKTGIIHQSPQVIVLYKNEVIYHASHQNIDAEKISALIKPN